MALRPIVEIAESLGIEPEELEPRGHHIAKIRLDALRRRADRPNGRLVLVTGMTPTPAGEGKTVTSISLAQGLAKIGKRSIVALRQPSMGPVFGVKGSAVGGGRAEVLPRNEITLHFTGDIHAVGAAHNLLAALLDNYLMRENVLGIDPNQIVFPRAVDMNDRALRSVLVAHGGGDVGVERHTEFVITAASEVMAILCLSESLTDLKRRLGQIIVGFTLGGQPVLAQDLRAEGAMAAILRDALNPNLVQTTEGVPAFIHGGPFANIAHGTNSIIATRLARKLAEYTVTEAGFAADLGAEKFLDIVSPQFDLAPDVAVVVTTIRALKRHGGSTMKKLNVPNVRRVKRGLPNLRHHVEIVRKFGVPVVVAVNHRASDAPEEVDAVIDACREWGVPVAAHDGFSDGGEGAISLAETVVETAESSESHYAPLYAYDEDPYVKMERIATEIYGAEGVDWTESARVALDRYVALGYGSLPICVAKTQSSLSDDPKKRGVPTDWRLTVRDVECRAGAGFLVMICGKMMLMPGLPATPLAHQIDVNEDGEILGLR